MEAKILNILNNTEGSNYGKAEICLNKIIKRKLCFEDIKTIFSLNCTSLIGEFLINYKHFDNNDLRYIEQYILDHLDHEDKMFVSDLIDFATYWEFQLPYEKCLGFLKVYENDNTYVQLSVIDYIFENLKFSYISEIVKLLQEILDSREMYNSIKVKAAFVMFRITMKKKYLEDLIDLVITDDNRKLLQNMLKQKYNSQKYFDYHNLLKYIAYTTTTQGGKNIPKNPNERKKRLNTERKDI